MHDAAAELELEAMKAARDAVKPFAPSLVREGARALPASGGLRQRVEGYDVEATATPTQVSIRLTGVAGYDRGRVLHPVFGNRDVWVEQPLNTKGDFSRALARVTPKIMPRVEAAVQNTLADVARKV